MSFNRDTGFVAETSTQGKGMALHVKLMRSNRPKAKIGFKSYSNCLLIDFFDPISSLEIKSSRRNRFQQHSMLSTWKTKWTSTSTPISTKTSSNSLLNTTQRSSHHFHPSWRTSRPINVKRHFSLKISSRKPSTIYNIFRTPSNTTKKKT